MGPIAPVRPRELLRGMMRDVVGLMESHPRVLFDHFCQMLLTGIGSGDR